MLYKNRYDASLKLIPFLEKYQNTDSVILAVPRGGVPLGYSIARILNLPLDLLLAKKIGHPFNKELAIGAVTIEDEITDDYPYISSDYFNEQIQKIRESLIKSYKKFSGDRTPIDLKNKTIIIIDDGIATGNTLLSAINMIRKKVPKKIIVAVPVAPTDSAKKISDQVDEFICPLVTDSFIGVGGYYLDFSQVTDEEVVSLMNDDSK